MDSNKVVNTVTVINMPRAMNCTCILAKYSSFIRKYLIYISLISISAACYFGRGILSHQQRKHKAVQWWTVHPVYPLAKEAAGSGSACLLLPPQPMSSWKALKSLPPNISWVPGLPASLVCLLCIYPSALLLPYVSTGYCLLHTSWMVGQGPLQALWPPTCVLAVPPLMAALGV